MIERYGPLVGKQVSYRALDRGASEALVTTALIARHAHFGGADREERQANTLHGFCTLMHAFSCFVLRAEGHRESPLSPGDR